MVDRAIWHGARALVDDYAHISPEDFALILFTSDSHEAAAWLSAEMEARGLRYLRLWMAPITDDGLAERLDAALPAEDAITGRVVVFTFERDTMSHGRTIGMALARYDRSRISIFRAIGTCAELFTHALHATPDELSGRNTAPLERFMSAERLVVKTAGGTDLRIGLDARHRWISNRGVSSRGGAVILPAGEIATFPASIEGMHVADFAFNVNMITRCDARLDTSPVRAEIAGGRVVDIQCEDASVLAFVRECLHSHCAFNVGELGFGTNFRIVDPIGLNSHINERRPGIHLGLGQHNQDTGIVGYDCRVHLDLIARGGRVWVDDDPVPVDLETVVPSSSPHPHEPRDEDVFSPNTVVECDIDADADDCCGLATAAGALLCP